MNIVVAYFENLTHVVGGLEKVICDFSNEFVRRGHRVTVVTFDQSEGRPYYPLSENVQIINLRGKDCAHLTGSEKIMRECWRLFGKKASRQWKYLWKRRHGITRFNEVIRDIRPDVIVSFEPMTSAEIVSEGIQTPLVSSLQNDPATRCQYFTSLEKRALECSAAVHVLMPSFRNTVKKFIKQENVICIPNTIPQYGNQANLEEEKEIYRIVNVGRLNKKHKRQEILIEAFAMLAERYPDWIVECWGGDTSGYQKELEQKIHHYRLENRVFLRGATQNVEQVYCAADIFAFPSRCEGFGLALGEAMCAGLPAVGFASCPAVNELIKNGENGLLAEEGVSAFSKALEALMQEKSRRVQMGKKARQMMQAYSPEHIWAQWEQVLQRVAKRKN